MREALTPCAKNAEPPMAKRRTTHGKHSAFAPKAARFCNVIFNSSAGYTTLFGVAPVLKKNISQAITRHRSNFIAFGWNRGCEKN